MMILAPRYIVFKISSFCFIPIEMSRTRFPASTWRLYFFEMASVSSIAFFLSRNRPFFFSIPRTRFSATVRDGASIMC